MKKVQVNEKKKVVTCVLNDDGLQAVGIARCNPEDTFNVEVGEKLALKRAKLRMNKLRVKRLERDIKIKLNEVALLRKKTNSLIDSNYKLDEEIAKFK